MSVRVLFRANRVPVTACVNTCQSPCVTVCQASCLANCEGPCTINCQSQCLTVCQSYWSQHPQTPTNIHYQCGSCATYLEEVSEISEEPEPALATGK